MKPRPVDGLAVLALAGILSLAAPAAPARADAADGARLARQWCVACHLVEPGGGGVDTAPPFATMANDPAYTRDRLRRWLMDPHPPMENIHLSRRQIDDIQAYIDSLRDN
ncbi:MAG: c-type cytochrome [Alphaproteobacteria bacterium]